MRRELIAGFIFGCLLILGIWNVIQHPISTHPNSTTTPSTQYSHELTESEKYQNIRKWGKCMDDGTDPLYCYHYLSLNEPR